MLKFVSIKKNLLFLNCFFFTFFWTSLNDEKLRWRTLKKKDAFCNKFLTSLKVLIQHSMSLILNTFRYTCIGMYQMNSPWKTLFIECVLKCFLKDPLLLGRDILCKKELAFCWTIFIKRKRFFLPLILINPMFLKTFHSNICLQNES